VGVGLAGVSVSLFSAQPAFGRRKETGSVGREKANSRIDTEERNKKKNVSITQPSRRRKRKQYVSIA
jgi:hypothetical protein